MLNQQIKKLLNFFFTKINYFYNFQGLHFFKGKYDPIWEPRYLAYPAATSLPPLAANIIRLTNRS